MKPAVKWGIAAASGAAVFLALRKMKKAQEQNADNTQLALQQLVESSQSSEIVETYGEWRPVKQPATLTMAYYHLDLPPKVEGKTLINCYIEAEDKTSDWNYGTFAEVQAQHSGLLLCGVGKAINNKFRIVGQWI